MLTNCDSEIRELRENQQELSSQLEERQLNVQQLQGTSDTLDEDVERLMEQKQKVRFIRNRNIKYFTSIFLTGVYLLQSTLMRRMAKVSFHIKKTTTTKNKQKKRTQMQY